MRRDVGDKSGIGDDDVADAVTLHESAVATDGAAITARGAGSGANIDEALVAPDASGRVVVNECVTTNGVLGARGGGAVKTEDKSFCVDAATLVLPLADAVHRNSDSCSAPHL